VARKRLEERDLRSLERRRLFSIFRPLNASERAAQDERPKPSRSLLALPTFIFTTSGREMPWWLGVFGLLLFPALLIAISAGLWLQLPALAIWLSIVALFAAYMVGAVVINLRR
jgi:hypothetical protein